MHALAERLTRPLRKSTASLRTVLMLSLLVGIGVPAALTVAWEHDRQTRQFARQLQADLQKTSTLLADGVKEAVWQMSPQDADAIVAAAFADERIVEIDIQDARDTPFISRKRAGVDATQLIAHEVALQQDGKPLGKVAVRMDARANRQQLDDALAMSLRLVLQSTLGAVILIGILLQLRLIRPLQQLARASDTLAQGHLDQAISSARSDEIGQLARSMDATRLALAAHIQQVSELAQAAADLQKAQDFAALGACLMAWLQPRLDVGQGSLYIADPAQRCLNLAYAYARPLEAPLAAQIAYGHGLTGQCAIEQKAVVLHAPGGSYPPIRSGLGNTAPCDVLIQPLVANERVLGVLELALFKPLDSKRHGLLQRLLPTICLCVEVLGRSLAQQQAPHQPQQT